LKISSEINTGFLDQAEQELFEIIFQQRRAFNIRWRSSRIFQQGLPILRVTGISLSVVGAVLCIYLFVRTPAWCTNHFYALSMLLLFVLFFVLFYFQNQLDHYLQQCLEKWIIGNCKKQAAKCVKAARACVPYSAEYEIRDKQIRYYRSKENKTDLVWTRKLDGVAFHRKQATIIYKKPTSFIPQIIILHAEFGSLEEALRAHGVQILP